MKSISTEDILKICENPQIGAFLKFHSGKKSQKVSRVADPSQEMSLQDSLCFANSLDFAKKAADGQARILVIEQKVDPTKLDLSPDIDVFTTPSITAAMTLVLPLLDDKKSRFVPAIHPSAVIAKTAKIGKNVLIGAHCVIEDFAEIGDDTILHPLVFIGARCVIGKSCEIHPHTTIGSDGFGFIKDPQGIQRKIPQLGIVVLEDHVEMGANCAVDRATLTETRIGEGSKFDNLCHIAHNCRIGKRNVFAGAFMIAGSSVIGDDCMFGGGTLVSDHVVVGNKIVVGGKSGITKDTLEPGAYAGFPLQPYKEGVRNLANITKLSEMRKDISAIKTKLNMKDEE